MEEIAPGSILQRMFFKTRIRKLTPGRFCEIGCGSGYVSEILLNQGWNGMAFDLGKGACENSRARNARFIKENKYQVVNGDFLDAELTEKFDLIFSMFVLEHLSEENVERYFKKCKELLKPGGTLALFVPGGMKFWSIEDDIAGHLRRYEFSDFPVMEKKYGLRIRELSGLTYPVSNLLLGMSNYLVRRSESEKKALSAQEQTIQSGNRQVVLKTSFPVFLKIILNEWVLFPLYVLQRLFKNYSGNMIIYCEFDVKP